MDEQDGAGLSPRMIVVVADARKQSAKIDRRISAFDAEFVRWVKDNEEARRPSISRESDPACNPCSRSSSNTGRAPRPSCCAPPYAKQSTPDGDSPAEILIV